MLLTVVPKLYKVCVLLEYFDLLPYIANLTGQDSQPCCNSLSYADNMPDASYYAKNYAME